MKIVTFEEMCNHFGFTTETNSFKTRRHGGMGGPGLEWNHLKAQGDLLTGGVNNYSGVDGGMLGRVHRIKVNEIVDYFKQQIMNPTRREEANKMLVSSKDLHVTEKGMCRILGWKLDTDQPNS